MKNKFEDLKFHKINAEFKDNRKMVAGFVKGSFTREEVYEKLQELADGMKKSGRNAYIAVTLHYADPNAWLPAIYTHVSQPVQIFNPNDSDTTNTFKDISAMYFYIIEKPEGEVLTQKMHTVKKDKVDKVDKAGFLFDKKKK